jgi:hypothetical protein
MTPPETVQSLPLLSVSCVADGVVVPLSEAVPGTAASMTDAPMAELFCDDGDSAELLPPHAASVRHETASAATQRLLITRIESSLIIGSYRVEVLWPVPAARKCRCNSTCRRQATNRSYDVLRWCDVIEGLTDVDPSQCRSQARD